MNTIIRKYFFADLLVKPADKFHIKSKSTDTLIKSFLETAENLKFKRSLYHQALLAWHVYDDRSIPNPCNNPYYITFLRPRGPNYASEKWRSFYHGVGLGTGSLRMMSLIYALVASIVWLNSIEGQLGRESCNNNLWDCLDLKYILKCNHE